MTREITQRLAAELKEAKGQAQDISDMVERFEELVKEAYDAGFNEGVEEGKAQGE